MNTVEETRLKETPERAQSWIAKELVTSHVTLKKVRQQMSDYLELSRSEFIMLVDQCLILVVIAAIVAALIAA
jgi:hypothetical protein